MKIFYYIILLIVSTSIAYANEQLNSSIEINADSLEIDQNKKIAIFVGNVTAKEKDIVIKAVRMIAYYDDKLSKISMVELIDQVVITKQDQIIKGDLGIFDIFKNEIKLNNNVVLIKGNNILKGNNLIYNLNLGEAKIYNSNNNISNENNRVKAVFTPSDIK